MGMRKVSKPTRATLDALVEGLDNPCVSDGESSRKIGKSGGAYMPVSVERLGRDLFSVAHYAEQNGDLMSDPEMTFWRDRDGEWYPASMTQHFVGRYEEAIVEWNGDMPSRFNPRAQRDMAVFAATWMENIRMQQPDYFVAATWRENILVQQPDYFKRRGGAA